MAEYINRDDVLKIFSCDLAEKDRQVSWQSVCIDVAFKIMNIPTIEVEEKQHEK